MSKPLCITHSCASLTQIMASFWKFPRGCILIGIYKFLNLKPCVSYHLQDRIRKSERDHGMKAGNGLHRCRKGTKGSNEGKEDLICLGCGGRDAAGCWDWNSLWKWKRQSDPASIQATYLIFSLNTKVGLECSSLCPSPHIPFSRSEAVPKWHPCCLWLWKALWLTNVKFPKHTLKRHFNWYFNLNVPFSLM